MSFKEKLLILPISILLVCCNTNSKIKVSLKKEINKSVQFSDFRLDEHLLFSYKKKYPKLYAAKLEMFKGIPKLDSMTIVSRSFQSLPFNFDLQKYGNIKKIPTYGQPFSTQDSVKLATKKLRYEINAVSGFLNKKQIIIVDANNNYDFSDDKVFYFDSSFRLINDESDSKIDSLPLVKFNYQILQEGVYYTIERAIQIYPMVHHQYSYLLMLKYIDSTLNNYTLKAQFKDFRFGEFNIGKNNYSVALKGFRKNDSKLLIKPNSISDDLSGPEKINYTYKNNDTVKLENAWYQIKVQNDLSGVLMTKLALNPLVIFGYRQRDIIKNFKLRNVQALDSIEVYKVINQKKYTLIDFWGTWCVPCLKTTPVVKEMFKSHQDKLAILSVAYDKDIDKVRNYIKKEGLNWKHAFVAQQGSAIDIEITLKLKIASFPTFILLDNKGEIVLRGGTDMLFKINDFLKNDLE